MCDQLHATAALPQEKEPSHTYWIGSLIALKDGLNSVEKRTPFTPAGNRTQLLGQPASHYTELQQLPLLLLLSLLDTLNPIM
jgi:hypothetical protein